MPHNFNICQSFQRSDIFIVQSHPEFFYGVHIAHELNLVKIPRVWKYSLSWSVPGSILTFLSLPPLLPHSSCQILYYLDHLPTKSQHFTGNQHPKTMMNRWTPLIREKFYWKIVQKNHQDEPKIKSLFSCNILTIPKNGLKNALSSF